MILGRFPANICRVMLNDSNEQKIAEVRMMKFIEENPHRFWFTSTTEDSGLCKEFTESQFGEFNKHCSNNRFDRVSIHLECIIDSKIYQNQYELDRAEFGKDVSFEQKEQHREWLEEILRLSKTNLKLDLARQILR